MGPESGTSYSSYRLNVLITLMMDLIESGPSVRSEIIFFDNGAF